jgi:predicted RNase H-like HicB family nuclease
MRIPPETIQMETRDDRLVARTTLLDAVEGRGATEAEARAELCRAADAYLRHASLHGLPIPEELRPSRRTKVIAVTVFVALFLALTAIGSCLSYQHSG